MTLRLGLFYRGYENFMKFKVGLLAYTATRFEQIQGHTFLEGKLAINGSHRDPLNSETS